MGRITGLRLPLRKTDTPTDPPAHNSGAREHPGTSGTTVRHASACAKGDHAQPAQWVQSLWRLERQVEVRPLVTEPWRDVTVEPAH